MKKLLVLLLSLFALGVAQERTTITVKGSDTMVLLGQRWAENFMKQRKDVSIQVTGGGSGTGISALINGTTDICNSSRPMKRSEMEKLKERYNTLGIEVKVARDGIALYVNEKNPVKELSLAQIKDIYTGKVKNWKEVGGSDAPIILYSRENNSGTYVYFKEEVLMNEDFHTSAQNMPGTAAVVNAIAKDVNGIGYGGAAYGKGIREVAVKQNAESKAYTPSLESINKGEYPISRYLYLYLRVRPAGATKDFIDWILSADGQKIVSEVGYFPVK